tara:strand:+ start:1131 stop:1301 length:171 start_codon:yes stop_codon:yes gene_type:complete
MRYELMKIKKIRQYLIFLSALAFVSCGGSSSSSNTSSSSITGLQGDIEAIEPLDID